MKKSQIISRCNKKNRVLDQTFQIQTIEQTTSFQATNQGNDGQKWDLMFLLRVTRTFSRLNTSVPVSAGQILKFILDQMHVTYANACKMKNLAWNAVRNVL
jgi:hypothetical protein